MKKRGPIKMPGITSSNDKIYKTPRGVYRYVLTVGNLRVLATSLPESHEEYTEDTFEYAGRYYTVGEISEEEVDLLRKIMENPIFELRYGTYRAERIYTKR